MLLGRSHEPAPGELIDDGSQVARASGGASERWSDGASDGASDGHLSRASGETVGDIGVGEGQIAELS